MKIHVVAVAALAVALTGCSGDQGAVAHGTTAAGPTNHQLSPPRYRACKEVKLSNPTTRLPTYAHDVSCVIARAVAMGCYTRSCFGEFPLPYSGTGDPSFPEPPTYKPFGFECYQGVPSITVGLQGPTPPTGSEWRPFVCRRESPSFSDQLVGYFVLVGGGP